MKDFFRNITITNDGATTLFLPEWEEPYHSKHGAIQESDHVFIKNGLEFCVEHKNQSSISLLEMGFGTGLNCLLTYQAALNLGIEINYVALEAYPVSLKEVAQLNFPTILKSAKLQKVFEHLHESPWNQPVSINSTFELTKLQQQFEHFSSENTFDLIYFDVFGIRVQPELWTDSIFEKMYNALKNGGILVTYASNGNARRAMLQAGFTVEKIKGPHGKREMMRAFKN